MSELAQFEKELLSSEMRGDESLCDGFVFKNVTVHCVLFFSFKNVLTKADHSNLLLHIIWIIHTLKIPLTKTL